MGSNLSNPNYWNQRYEQRGIEGSGAGSRGDKVNSKIRFVQEQIDKHGIKSVFDFGCGNARVINGIQTERKMGYDFSSTIIDQLQQNPQNGTELSSDIQVISPRNLEQFDCALCMEVLFHNTRIECADILRTIADARVRLFICCDSTGDIWSSRFLGRHIKKEPSRDLVESYFREYKRVAEERFMRGAEMYAMLKRDA